MNWKIKLVLLFGKLRKPIEVDSNPDIAKLRKLSEKAAGIGTRWFDTPVEVLKVTDTSADGIPVRIYQNSTRYKPARIYLLPWWWFCFIRPQFP